MSLMKMTYVAISSCIAYECQSTSYFTVHANVTLRRNIYVCLFTRVFLGALRTLVTVNVATPMEFAVTLPYSSVLMCIVASSTAH